MDLSPNHLHGDVELESVREEDREGHQDLSALGKAGGRNKGLWSGYFLGER